MKLKLDEAGHVVVTDGNPVYVHDDGKEIPFDAKAASVTIGRLNSEAKTRRERQEEIEARLKGFDGIDDPEAARKALATIKNFDDKKLVDAGEVERVKSEAIKATEDRYKPFVKKAETLEQLLRDEKIGGSFARSKFIADKLAIPQDMVQSRFGQQFKIEDGRVVGYDISGNKLFSRSRPGELADFDEAMELLVDQYPYKDHILKGTQASGSGARNGNGAGGGAKTMTRMQFDAMAQHERAQAFKDGYKVVDA